MDTMSVYITVYSEDLEDGETGAWFTLPFDYDKVEEILGIDIQYENYTVQGDELPFDIDDDITVEELNDRYNMYEELPDYIKDNLDEIIGYFDTFEGLYDFHEYIICYSGCESIAALVREYSDTERFGEIPVHLKDFIDYEAYIKTIDIASDFIETNNGVIEIPY